MRSVQDCFSDIASVDNVLKYIQTTNKLHNLAIIDIGTGSGNIIIAIARNIKKGPGNNVKFYGIDISDKALAIAKYNARKNNVSKKIKFVKQD